MADQIAVTESFIRPQRGNAEIAYARQFEGTKAYLHALLLLLLGHHGHALNVRCRLEKFLLFSAKELVANDAEKLDATID
jgi:hypothetical protein